MQFFILCSLSIWLYIVFAEENDGSGSAMGTFIQPYVRGAYYNRQWEESEKRGVATEGQFSVARPQSIKLSGSCPTGCVCDEERHSLSCYKAEVNILKIILHDYHHVTLRDLISENQSNACREVLIHFLDANASKNLHIQSLALGGCRELTNKVLLNNIPSSVQYLNLADNSITDFDWVNSLGKLPQLKELYLSRNWIQALPPPGIRHTSLEKIDLSFNAVGPELALDGLKGMTELRSINLRQNRIRSVKKFTGLNKIGVELTNNPVTCSCNLYQLQQKMPVKGRCHMSASGRYETIPTLRGVGVCDEEERSQLEMDVRVREALNIVVSSDTQTLLLSTVLPISVLALLIFIALCILLVKRGQTTSKEQTQEHPVQGHHKQMVMMGEWPSRLRASLRPHLARFPGYARGTPTAPPPLRGFVNHGAMITDKPVDVRGGSKKPVRMQALV